MGYNDEELNQAIISVIEHLAGDVNDNVLQKLSNLYGPAPVYIAFFLQKANQTYSLYNEFTAYDLFGNKITYDFSQQNFVREFIISYLRLQVSKKRSGRDDLVKVTTNFFRRVIDARKPLKEPVLVGESMEKDEI